MTRDPGAAAWFETTASREVYRGFSTVRIESLRTPDGNEVEREIVEHDDAVAVVPVTAGGEVLLLRQYRQSVRRYLLEIPAGKLDVDGEAPAAAANRELVEETGHEAGSLDLLTTFQNSAGWTTEVTHVYLGRDLSPSEPPDSFTAKAEELDMEIVPLRLADAVAAVHAGEITDGKTVVGLLLAADRLDT